MTFEEQAPLDILGLLARFVASTDAQECPSETRSLAYFPPECLSGREGPPARTVLFAYVRENKSTYLRTFLETVLIQPECAFEVCAEALRRSNIDAFRITYGAYHDLIGVGKSRSLMLEAVKLDQPVTVSLVLDFQTGEDLLSLEAVALSESVALCSEKTRSDLFRRGVRVTTGNIAQLLDGCRRAENVQLAQSFLRTLGYPDLAPSGYDVRSLLGKCISKNQTVFTWFLTDTLSVNPSSVLNIAAHIGNLDEVKRAVGELAFHTKAGALRRALSRAVRSGKLHVVQHLVERHLVPIPTSLLHMRGDRCVGKCVAYLRTMRL